jgi:metal-dependent amidase/aminoacylase/carboxypeptidase family protein
MSPRMICFFVLALWAASARAQPRLPAQIHDASVQRWLDGTQSGWLDLYRRLHAAPELSNQERQTAALVAAELRRSGYEVSEGVGGFGVVGVLRNGSGSTVLLGGDMDALPVLEQTGLPFQSRVQVKDDDGQTVSVMHACGHDLHVTNLLASAAFLAQYKALWSGTLLIVAQPAEEVGGGASAMIAAGLFKRFPRPGFALALHVEPELPARHVAASSGWAALARDICAAFQCPKAPEMRTKESSTPAVYNDPQLAAAASRVFATVLGPQAVETVQPTMGGEDFGLFGKTLGIPSLLFRLGATPDAVYRAAKRPGADPPPSLHSSRFAPDAALSLRTGVRASVSLVLSLLQRE